MKYILVNKPSPEYYIEGMNSPRLFGDLSLRYKILPKTTEEPTFGGSHAILFEIVGEGTLEQELNLMREVAKQHLGCDVLLLATVSIGTTPPGEYIQKAISKDGVLPT